MHYTLNLPKGKITWNNQTHGYQGVSTDGEWAPYDPVNSESGGWSAGDTLTVQVAFDLNPTNLPPGIHPPSASEYHGCAAIALYNPTTAQIRQAKRDLYSGPGWDKKGFVGAGISKSSEQPSPGSGIYFYDATSEDLDDQLKPPSRGKLSNLIYEWKMKYYADPTLTNPAEGSHITLVFGYGDPMTSVDKS